MNERTTDRANSRYALYFAPPPESGLWAFGSRWLGRDAATGTEITQPAVNGVDAERLFEVTASPRHYGFHATLKPPFALRGDTTIKHLDQRLKDFAAGRNPFTMPGLAVGAIGDFLALRPIGPCAELDALAAACVRSFDHMRASPSPGELHKRLSGGLTSRQEELLSDWGYPYVFEEFRFHMSLTGRVKDDAERENLAEILAEATAEHCHKPLTVDAVTLYHQPTRETPFTIVARFPFGGTAEADH